MYYKFLSAFGGLFQNGRCARPASRGEWERRRLRRGKGVWGKGIAAAADVLVKFRNF